MAELPAVRLYGIRFCPYCIRARMLLKSKGIEFSDIPVGNDPEVYAEMVRLSGRETVPQIFIGDHHVGGYDDLALADRSGELNRLMGWE